MALLRQVMRHGGRFRFTLSALLAGCGLVGYFRAGTSEAAEKQTAPAKVWHLEGRVVGEKGQPVAGVRVFVNALPNLPQGNGASTESDAEGRFHLDVPQQFYFSVSASYDDGSRQAYYQVSLETGRDASPPPLELVLKPAREVQARVMDDQQQPVADATILISSNYQKLSKATTDGDGRARFRVPADAPLQYAVALKSGVGLDYWVYRRKDSPQSDPYQLAADRTEPLEFKLGKTRSVTVRVVDEQDRPLAGADVYPWYFQRPNKGEMLNLSGAVVDLHTKSDEQGLATVAFVPEDNEGQVVIWVRKPGYHAPERAMFDLASGETELTAILMPLVRVAGRVVFADGRPAADMEVLAAGAGYGTDGFRETTKTDAEGRFEFQAHPDQYYQFAAGNQEWASPAVNKIVRAGALMEAVELVLQPATRVFGRVTMGSDDSPVPKQYVSLYQENAVSYYDLLEAERLPNPKEGRHGISPRIVRGGTTDDDGRFEFFTGPGKYYMFGPNNVEPPKFEITDQRELEISLHAERSDVGPISGRVVLADDPSQGVVDAKVAGVPTESRLRDLAATSGADGRFRAERGLATMFVHAAAKDEKLAGIVKIGADDAEVVIPIGPTGGARGLLMDDETNGPAVERTIEYGVRINFGDKTFGNRFGGKTKTDANGQFAISGLVVGQEYDLNAVIETDSDGYARSWRTVGKVTATNTDSVDLGELRLPVSYRPLTTAQRVAKAFEAKPAIDARVRERVRDGRLAHQRALLVVGAEGNPVVQQLYEIEYDYTQPELSKPLYDYLLLPINAGDEQKREEASELAARFKFDLPEADGATLVVLDEDGALVAQIADKELVEGGKIAPAKLLDFLQANRPQLPDAEVLLTEAIAKAKQEGKRVLVQVSGARCGWCFVLSRYLDDHHELFDKEFTYVKLDDRWAHGAEVIQRVRPKQEGGIPWMVILDENGEPLITSDGPDGNIGYPGEPEGAVHFEKMLRTGTKHLTDDDIAALVKPLGKKN